MRTILNILLILPFTIALQAQGQIPTGFFGSSPSDCVAFHTGTTNGELVTLPSSSLNEFSIGDTLDKPFSLVIRIKVDGGYPNNIYINRYHNFSFGGSFNGIPQLTLEDNSAGVIIQALMYDTIGSGGYNIGVADKVDEWVVMATTYTGSGKATGIEVYLNGETNGVIRYENASYVAMDYGGDIMFSHFGLTAHSFIWSEALLFNRVLTPSEISDVSNGNQLRDETLFDWSGDLITHIRASDATTGVNGVTDLSGNGEHATMTNMEIEDIIDCD